MNIRPANPDDAAECGRILYEAFSGINREHGFPPEIPSAEAGAGMLGMLFSHPGFRCVIAESEGRIVGSNCLDERGAIAGIGPVAVDPTVQNRGVGRALMLAVMDRARVRNFPGVRLLQSAFHNRSLSLYVKLGFDVREPMSVMQGPPIGMVIDGCDVRPATEDDVDAANALCQRVHGHNRVGELRESIAQHTGIVVERHGRLTGYATGFGYFGHAVGESNLDVQALIAAAGEFQGPGIIVPTRNMELLRWCLDHGLRIFQPMTLMTIGLYNEPAGAYLPSVLY
ncbi:MAG TPA: GNAT family N-acetyltransferase [Bryobacteraceae bacterium]|nr:GNAT family N-acetyltransferase [Bryobacteraceae bacterium]